MKEQEKQRSDISQEQENAELSVRSDAELHALIDDAREILKAREDERRAQALAEMRRLAKENGLVFSAKKKPARKRRRNKETRKGEGEH